MSDTQLQAIVMKPGIMKDSTEYLAEGGWVDGDKIRFRSGSAEKIGGWVRETVSQSEFRNTKTFTGTPRAVISWDDLNLKQYLAVGTNAKLELMNGGLIYDITPARETVTLFDAITTVTGQSIVTITDTNHGLVKGDFIFVESQGFQTEGVLLHGTYIILNVVDGNNYQIDSGTIAGPSGNPFDSSFSSAFGIGFGGKLVIDYLLPTGSISNGSLSGWGGGTWGTPGQGNLGWGAPRQGTGGLSLREWSLDNWGQDLIACPSGGGIYQWVAGNGVTNRAQILDNAPTQNNLIMIDSIVRILIAFGSQVEATGLYDPMIIRWASQESLTDWTITDNNTAGEYRLPGGNKIIAAVHTRSEILVFTDTDVYSMVFIGGNDIYQFTPLGTNVSCISQHAVVDINGTIMWMGNDAFYYYNGMVNILPNTLNKYLFAQLGDGRYNVGQKEKTYCGILKEFNEIFWFYPRYDNTECSHYIKYNFLENIFDYGEMNRCVWLDRSVFSQPYAIDENGVLFQQEQGFDDDGAPMEAFIKSAYFDIEDGTEMLFVDRILPDIKLNGNNNVEVTIFTKRYPHPQAEVTTKGPYFFSDSDDKISIRARGRQMAIEYRVNGTGSTFEIGKVRIGIQKDGQR